MRDTGPQASSKFLSVLTLFIGMAVGQVSLAASEEGSAPPAASTEAAASVKAVAVPLTGPQVYNAVCIACHAPPGLGGAPALGNPDAWAPRIERGMDSLIHHALNGFSGSAGIMPRKGGRTDLSDEEIISAVEYMIEQAAE